MMNFKMIPKINEIKVKKREKKQMFRTEGSSKFISLN